MKTILIKSILYLSAKVPLRLVHLFGTWLGNVLMLIDNESKRIARINLAHCFSELENAQQQQLLRQTMQETCKTLLENGRVWRTNKTAFPDLIKAVYGEEHLQQGLAIGKGLILAIPHLGNWEMVGLYCSSHYLMTSLYRPPRLAGVDSLIREARERFGARLVPTNAKGVRALYQALSNNELVAILPDQDPRDSGGNFVPFFGIQTNTMTLLTRLAHKSQATVLCSYAERLPHGQGFTIHFTPVPTAFYQTDINTSITALNQIVEQSIRRIPAQYQWGYKRFRTRPQGEQDFYS